MNNYIIVAGALGVGYLIYNSSLPLDEKKEKEGENVKMMELKNIPEGGKKITTIEVTKIGLLPPEDKKALIMNLKNAKSYSSTFAIVTAVIGGVFTSFYISKKMIIVMYEFYKNGSTGGAYGFPLTSFKEIFPVGMPDFIVYWYDRKKPTFSKDEPVDLDSPKGNRKKLDEIEENNNNEIKDIRDMLNEDPTLTQSNISLESFKGGTFFIKPESEIKIEENVKIEESMQTATINKIDNITIGVEKSEEPKIEEPKVELTELEKKIIEDMDGFLLYINNSHSELEKSIYYNWEKQNEWNLVKGWYTFFEEIFAELKEKIENKNYDREYLANFIKNNLNTQNINGGGFEIYRYLTNDKDYNSYSKSDFHKYFFRLVNNIRSLN